MRVLSIQSHVVSGYVGNKAAVFPLQLLGYDVDVLNSCNLSNHTGYSGGAPGHRLTGEHLISTISGLEKNDLVSSITHLLTGFIGTPSFLLAVVDTVAKLRSATTGRLTYICDPVLGDRGKLYVPRELVSIYRERVLSLATVLTPNVFELGLLSEVEISSEKAAFTACTQLHADCKVPLIVVTGAQFADRPCCVSLLVSTLEGSRFAVDADLLNGTFTGSGDLTAALILAWRERIPHDLRSASRHVMATVSAVLQRTLDTPQRSGKTRLPELCLIQSKDDILQPPVDSVRIREVEY